jgi:hypothetical protein
MKNNVAGLGMVAKNGVSPPRWEAEIWRITVLTRPAQAKKKKSWQDLISINKPGMVAHICDPSYAGITDRRSWSRPAQTKNVRPSLKSN